MRRWLAALVSAAMLSTASAQGARLDVCFNFGCMDEQTVTFSPEQFDVLRTEMAKATDAGNERERLEWVIARMYRWAGEQSPISVDRAGDFLDDAAHGRMDCIDHAITTTRMLELLQDAGALRHHRVLEMARRRSWIIMQHFSAVIEEMEDGRQYAVDTWFRDHADPAVVMDMEQWRNGDYPDDWNAGR
jgi:hypothetical protein